VLELERPTIRLSDWPALEQAVGEGEKLKPEKLKAVWDGIYSSAPVDVRTELDRLEWAEVKTRLEAMDEAEMRRVVAAWGAVPCANASVTSFSQVLTSILQCNTAPYVLGARESSRATSFYLVKYMTKDCVALHRSLSVLVDAKRHIDRWESTAADVGMPERTAAHFLQRACNSYQAEVMDTQAASLLLNLHATYYSERFVYIAGHDITKGALAAGGYPDDYFENRRGEGAEGGEMEGDEEEHEIGADSAWTRLQKEERSLGDNEAGHSKTYELEDGTMVVVSQKDHYQLRGAALARFNAQEYASCVTVVKKTERDRVKFLERQENGRETFEAMEVRGRRPNAAVRCCSYI
jgi:hypothetical protein